jgi:hypothetical protein
LPQNIWNPTTTCRELYQLVTTKCKSGERMLNCNKLLVNYTTYTKGWVLGSNRPWDHPHNVDGVGTSIRGWPVFIVFGQDLR